MDARLVWDTWRRILTNDQLVKLVLHPGECGAAESVGLTAEEIAILADYASTPSATGTNIGMYRRGLVRNALAALRHVPLTRHLLYMSDLDVEATAESFVQSTGYVDDGPNFWRVAGNFVAYLGNLPEFGARSKQDILALDIATIALARRLGESAPAIWQESIAVFFSEADQKASIESARFVASPAAVVSTSHYDLTIWLENPEDFDADERLKRSTRYWLIHFPTADAEPEYAELSERAARSFNILSTPKTASELALALDGLPVAEVLEIIDSLSELGVIVNAVVDRPESENAALRAEQL